MKYKADLEFLKEIEKQAVSLERKIKSPDHWAKPFYSSVSLFKPRATRAFVGLNGAGDRFAKQYDSEDENLSRVWESNGPLFNAFLDERWGNQNGPSPVGEHSHQKAVHKVYKATYQNSWKRKLRSSACFNLLPVSSKGASDPKLTDVWDDGIAWGIKLIEYLRPKLLILNGNGQSKSLYSLLLQNYGLIETIPPIVLENPKFSLKEGKVASGPLKGTRVIGLPHLARNKATAALIRSLTTRRPYI